MTRGGCYGRRNERLYTNNYLTISLTTDLFTPIPSNKTKQKVFCNFVRL